MKARTQVLLVLTVIAALLATTTSVSGAQSQLPNEARPDETVSSSEKFEEEVLDGEEPLILLSEKEADELIKTDMGAWLEARKRMGFAGDYDMVAKLVRTREGQLGMDAWSVPLTFDERAEMDERARATSNSGKAREVLERSDGYADMYIDHQSGGTIFVNFSRDVDAKEEQAIKDLFEIPSRVKTRRVDHSLDQLRSLVSILDELRQEGRLPDVTSVRIGAKENAVLVGVSEKGVTTPSNPKTSPGFLEKMGQEVQESVEAYKGPAGFDSMIELHVFPGIQPDGCFGRNNCGTTPPENWRGGTGVDVSQSGNWASPDCTTGFVWVGLFARFVSTSGHCDVFTNRDVAIAGQNHGEHSSPGNNFDRFVVNSLATNWPVDDTSDYHSSVDSDIAMIAINPTRSDNRIYKSYQKRNWFINQQDDSFMQGDITCVSGRLFGWRCGSVIGAAGPLGAPFPHDPDLVYEINDLILYEFVWPGIHSSGGGNSGAPLIQGRAAHGVHFGSVSLTPQTPVPAPPPPFTEVVAGFTRIETIENNLPVTLCLMASAC